MAKKGFDRLQDISRGFQPARILLTACELGLFDHLEQAASARTVAGKVGAEARAVGILLDGLAALGLVEKKDDLYRNGLEASAYLVSTKPDWRGAIFRHMAACWQPWSYLTDRIKTGTGAAIGPQRNEADQRSFILGMHAVARDLAPRIASILPLPEEGRLLDLGGGPGTYCMAFCRRRPRLSCTLFDLPPTIEIAREVLAGSGTDVAERIEPRPGDFTTDDLGSEYNFAWLSQILHSYSEERCAALIRKVFGALASGGQVAVHEFALNQAKTAPLQAAMFSVHMLAVTEQGRAYSKQEISSWLREAGFVQVRSRQASPSTSLIMGRRP
ncbi:MAG: methyltransferase [Pseudomonadota bacterium]